MANEEDKRELVLKLNALAKRANGGKDPTPETWRGLFAKYDRDKDGLITPGELSTLLEDAEVGNFLTREMWVSSIIEGVDAAHTRDGGVSLHELMNVLKSIAVDVISDGISRVKTTLKEEFTPSWGGWDGGVLLLLGVGALVLLVDRK